MQTGSFRELGEPAWVNAYSNACEGLGPYPADSIKASGHPRRINRPDT